MGRDKKLEQSDEDAEKEIKAKARTAYDAQRARLERLMKVCFALFIYDYIPKHSNQTKEKLFLGLFTSELVLNIVLLDIEFLLLLYQIFTSNFYRKR